MSYTDIQLSTQFLVDYAKAPEDIRGRVDKLVDRLARRTSLPRGFMPHKAETKERVKIGYITRSGSHWRIAYWQEGTMLYFDRMLDHNEMNIYLRSIV